VTAPGSSGGGGGGVVALIAGGEVDVSADINLRGGVGGSDLVSAPCVGGGGGGSGGMLLVRGDTVELQANKALLSGGAAGGEDNPPAATCAGGAGALGIIRLDGELTNAPGSAKQGPSLDDPPSVHFGQDGMITLQASGDPDGQAFEVIVGDTTLDPLTDPDKEFTVLLSPGLNRVCIGVPNAEPDGPEEALNCYSIAFIPAPAL
jgi:hypothetical protein